MYVCLLEAMFKFLNKEAEIDRKALYSVYFNQNRSESVKKASPVIFQLVKGTFVVKHTKGRAVQKGKKDFSKKKEKKTLYKTHYEREKTKEE